VVNNLYLIKDYDASTFSHFAISTFQPYQAPTAQVSPPLASSSCDYVLQSAFAVPLLCWSIDIFSASQAPFALGFSILL
jgi:hypothetical protein